jgi:hypothetical protein
VKIFNETRLVNTIQDGKSRLVLLHIQWVQLEATTFANNEKTTGVVW